MTPAAHWKILDSEPEDLTVVEATSSPGPGGILMLESAYENVTELCSSVLEPGRHSGLPASHAAQQLKAWQKSRTPVGIHLADQLLLPLAMAGKGRFATCTSSDHTHSHSHLKLIPRFLPVTEPSDGGVITISLRTTGRPGPSHPVLSHPRPSHLEAVASRAIRRHRVIGLRSRRLASGESPGRPRKLGCRVKDCNLIFIFFNIHRFSHKSLLKKT